MCGVILSAVKRARRVRKGLRLPANPAGLCDFFNHYRHWRSKPKKDLVASDFNSAYENSHVTFERH